MAEDKMIVDPTVNPQAQRPGTVLPERTPGSAPSVVPLPDGADPRSAPGEHPLPEDAIDGYPQVAEAANSGDPVAYAKAAGGVPDPNDVPAEAETPKSETKATKATSTGSAPRSS